ncbi:MAG: TonB-dependent receptor [Proteobacteria bacterium]|nr:TonB-dependent receptor [Pseudomonadota bacterium]
MSFKYEHGEWDNSGQPYEIIKAGSLVAFGIEGEINGKSNMGDGAFAGFPDDGVQDIGSLQTFEGKLDEYVVTIEHNMNNGATVTAIGSYSSYDFERFLDADFNPLTVVRFDDTEDFEQTSLELRIASNTGGAFEYLAGIYYQDNELLADSLTYINMPTLGALVTGGCLAGGGASIAGDVLGTVFANAALGTSAATATACFNQSVADPMLAAGLPGVMRYALLDQDTEILAIFGQVDWNLTDTLRGTLGLRYTEEDKTARQAVIPTDYGRRNTTQTTDPLSAAASTVFTEFTPHDFRDLERDESSFTWSANIRWDLSESVMTYVSASTGFKAGGFNSFYMGNAAGAGADPEDVDFEEEEVIAAELGVKMSLLDGTAELNVAFFWNQYDDLQASVFSGQTTVEVRNAAEATSQGIEIDARWHATDNFMLTGALGWLDFEFDSFPNQACTSDQFVAFREAAWDGGNNPFGAFANNGDCAQAGVNDMKGRTSANTAEFSATVSASYTRDLGDYRLALVADVMHNDDMYRQDDLDPTLKADSYTTVNALLRFGPSNGQWELAVIGKNLTDVDDNFYYGTDVPLFDGSIYAGITAPRNITVAATLNF